MNNTDFEQDTNQKTVSKLGCILLIISILLAFGAILIGVLWKNGGIWADIITSFLVTIVPIIGISAIWDIWERKKFAKKVLHAAGLSYKLQPSGITQFASSFVDIDFHDYILNADSITVVFTYARTWRETNRNTLREMLKRGGTLTVFLPNYKINKYMTDFDNRFFEKKGTTMNRIKKAIAFFEDYEKEFKNQVKIYLFDGVFTTSYYLIGNIGIMATFNHSDKKDNAPALICNKDGDVYKFIQKDIDNIKGRSNLYKQEKDNND